MSPFILPCFCLSLTGQWNSEKYRIEVLMNCNGLYVLYHTNGQMHVYMIASCIEIINKHTVCRVLIQVRQVVSY